MLTGKRHEDFTSLSPIPDSIFDEVSNYPSYTLFVDINRRKFFLGMFETQCYLIFRGKFFLFKYSLVNFLFQPHRFRMKSKFSLLNTCRTEKFPDNTNKFLRFLRRSLNK